MDKNHFDSFLEVRLHPYTKTLKCLFNYEDFAVDTIRQLLKSELLLIQFETDERVYSTYNVGTIHLQSEIHSKRMTQVSQLIMDHANQQLNTIVEYTVTNIQTQSDDSAIISIQERRNKASTTNDDTKTTNLSTPVTPNTNISEWIIEITFKLPLLVFLILSTVIKYTRQKDEINFQVNFKLNRSQNAKVDTYAKPKLTKVAWSLSIYYITDVINVLITDPQS
jgi:hypothetical protein